MNFDEEYRLGRAKEFEERGDDDSLIYCCLELRLCIELICYRRLSYFREALPASARRAWRAKEVIETLLEIDPSMGKELTVARGLVRADGTRTRPIVMGTYKPITRDFLTKYYDPFSRFVHAPTIDEVDSGSARDAALIRGLAQEAIVELREIAGNIFQYSWGKKLSFPCSGCGSEILRSVERVMDGSIVTCFEKSCRAEYQITFPLDAPPDLPYLFKPIQVSVECHECGATTFFEKRLAMKDRAVLTCHKCKALSGVAKTWILVPLSDEALSDPEPRR